MKKTLFTVMLFVATMLFIGCDDGASTDSPNADATSFYNEYLSSIENYGITSAEDLDQILAQNTAMIDERDVDILTNYPSLHLLSEHDATDYYQPVRNLNTTSDVSHVYAYSIDNANVLTVGVYQTYFQITGATTGQKLCITGYFITNGIRYYVKTKVITFNL